MSLTHGHIEVVSRKCEAMFRAIFLNPVQGIVVFDPMGRFSLVNERAQQFFGRSMEELEFLSDLDITHPDDMEISRARMGEVKKGKIDSCRFEKRYIRKDGSIFWADLSVTPIYNHQKELEGFVGVFVDIAERKQAEEVKQKLENQAQLAHADRLTALGEMASAMAHEMNQPLTVIRLAADGLKTYLTTNRLPADQVEVVDDMIEQVKRAANLIKNMRSFARVGDSENLQSIDLAGPIQVALSFFREQFRIHGIDLSVSLAEGLPKVNAEPQKIEQIVVNFMSNARYAVEQKGQNVGSGFQKRVAVRLSHDRVADRVVFEVQDNGIGMSPEVCGRCLEPFYTTKKTGEGTGLGLSIVHSLAKESNMQLIVESIEGEGSTFRIIAPGVRHE